MKTNLERKTANFIHAIESKGGQPIYKLTPDGARAALEKIQSAAGEKPWPAVTNEKKSIPGPGGVFSINILKPKNAKGKLPVIMFYHGAGWVMGGLETHERLARELCVNSNAAVVFVNYSRSPEARFPLPIEQAYAALKYISENGKKFNLDTSRIAVAGDSVGGNMCIAVTLLAKKRHGPKICYQALFYPVTSSELTSVSYNQFSEGPWLTRAAMHWFWDAYEPRIEARKNVLLSPLNASQEDLQGLPSALVITAENDVLRDEGEQYATKLMHAGVDVTAIRCLGTIHDFAMLNALAQTPAAQGAISVASNCLRLALWQKAQKVQKIVPLRKKVRKRASTRKRAA